jgi:hypothetical protein
MKYNETSRIPENPRPQFKEAVSAFDTWYRERNPLPYIYAGKDFANLKSLLRKLNQVEISLEEFLAGITSPWYLENASIPLFNSHFNQLIKNREPGTSYPDRYDPKFERSLEPAELPKYWKHLRGLGYERSYSPGGGSTWRK